MKTWRENYGADADGNRGIMTDMYELENTAEERNEIAKILYDNGYCHEDNGTAEIEYEGITIIVDVREYTNEIIAFEDGDNTELEKQMEEAERLRDVDIDAQRTEGQLKKERQ